MQETGSADFEPPTNEAEANNLEQKFEAAEDGNKELTNADTVNTGDEGMLRHAVFFFFFFLVENLTRTVRRNKSLL